MLAATLSLLLLALAIVSILLPRRNGLWSFVPLVLAGVALLSGAVRPSTAGSAAWSLAAPLAFVAFAVPLAVLLDRYGFFSELARLVSSGRRYLGSLWVLAAAVTVLLNLDAAVVLLTPLYVRIARHRGVSPLALAIQPALLSGLASSALPISNLTNLIAAARLGIPASGFVVHLGLVTVAASGAGWLAYRARFSRLAAAFPVEPGSGVDLAVAGNSRRVLAVGGLLVGAVVTGFLAVPAIGGQPWEVAAGGDLVLAALTRRLPWRSLPWQSVVAVLGLGMLAEGAAVHLPLSPVLSGSSPADITRIVAGGALSSNVLNNLPALLVALHAIRDRSGWTIWALLTGTNAGALFAPSGSLAVLLWLSTLERLRVDVRERHWWKAAWPVALAGLVAALAALLLLRAVLGPEG